MAYKRKQVIKAFCKNIQYVSMDSMNKILEIYFDQKVSERINYAQFIKFTRVDDTVESKNVFNSIVGDSRMSSKSNKKMPTIEAKILIIYILGTIENVEKDVKLKFAFDLYDEEDSR